MKYAQRTNIGQPRKHNKGMLVSTGSGAPALPRVTRPLPAGYTKKVECPTCKAGIGEDCVNAGLNNPADKGKPMQGVHPARKRMAVRLWNSEREDEGTLAPRDWQETKLGKLIDNENGILCPGCGLKIKKNLKGTSPVAHTVLGFVPGKVGKPRCVVQKR